MPEEIIVIIGTDVPEIFLGIKDAFLEVKMPAILVIFKAAKQPHLGSMFIEVSNGYFDKIQCNVSGKTFYAEVPNSGTDMSAPYKKYFLLGSQLFSTLPAPFSLEGLQEN